ncbi:MAG: ABC transporter permease [Bacteroidia bacterium]|nr:ABC transporter permease [Bacteroidia bacterium]
MIKKLLASVRKETLLLLRDRVGLAILFIMPMVLIFVMTLIQDSAFKTLNEKGIPVVFVNEDKDSLGITIEQGLRQAELCSFSDSIDGKPATYETAKNAVADGKFLVGVVIPKGATDAIRKNVMQLVEETLNTDSLQTIAISDSVDITIFIDPITKKSFLTSITSSLREFISIVKTKIMFQTFSDQIAEIIPDQEKKPVNAFNKTQIIKYKEVFASKQIEEIVPNAVQHNVPAWTIFAMFFIVIPMSGSIMKEKNEGSVFRLHTMPSSYLLLINGKIITYIFVCLIQFVLMMSVGLYFLPMLGLPKLFMGNSYFALFVITLATSFAATGYGVMVGTIASTEQQGAIGGALSILLFSAIGGVWVPTYVMPGVMRDLSALSPLNWSLNSFYELFLRGAGLEAVWYDALKLILFFLLTMTVASIANRVKRNV